ncbi:hypothetical protein AUP74_02456 [Microbulbifer aggregans]|uniref:MetA-pathway of phenol degradation n=1 Tax=Microbulbifer aggregans TaxID=1769779 RepID=A0A1C9W9L7_9GAMM|nr:hypothetical protein [Microbulbifer aggregans]AOS97856.1 hypothetical protein AUP74_02456 [Microbulbifer aggregans]
MRKTALYSAIVVAGVSVSSGALASEWKYTLGTDISSGDYGDSAETEIVSTPFTASYSPSDKWTFKASMPFVQIEGPGGVVPGGDGGVVVGRGNGNGLGNGGQQTQETEIYSESGLGDLWLTGTYSLEPVAERWFFDLSAKYKVPTADEEKGLGTGEADYSLQAEVFTVAGNFTPFATVARKFKGDLPESEIKDVWYMSVGSGYTLTENNSVGLSLDYQQATTDTSDPSTELFGYFNHKLNNQWSAMAYAYMGLADGSPDQGFGFQLSYRPGN